MKEDIIFAPWRMKYLEGPKLKGCFICEACRRPGKKANFVLAKTDRTAVVLNRYPYNSGHVMIAPGKHVRSFTSLDNDVLLELIQWVRATEIILEQVYHPDGMNIGVNLGEAAGAGLADHLHVHILPRWSGDTNFITTCGQIRVVPEVLKTTFEKLSPLYRKFKDNLV